MKWIEIVSQAMVRQGCRSIYYIYIIVRFYKLVMGIIHEMFHEHLTIWKLYSM